MTAPIGSRIHSKVPRLRTSIAGVVVMSAIAAATAGCAHDSESRRKQAERPEASSPAKDAADQGAIHPPVGDWKPIALKAPVELRLKGDPARVERVRYCARSDARTFVGPEMRNQKADATEFTIETRTTRIDAAADRISQSFKTAQKNGGMDLRDFAMPEFGETLDVVLSSQGRVLRAGNFPEGSLYYVPTVSLPSNAVSAGDTWTMQATWTPVGEDSALQLDMLSILKGFYACGMDHRCADVEITGGVQASIGGRPAPGYRNEWRGRMLFDVDGGLAIWSRLESEEAFEGERGRRAVTSSLEGALTEPAALKAAGWAPTPCGPTAK